MAHNGAVRRLLSGLVMVSLLSVPCLATARAGASQMPRPTSTYEEGDDAAAHLFDPLTLVDVDITLSDEVVDALIADPYTYQSATLSMTVDGEVKGPYAVQLKLKGRWGSFRGLDGKAAFKVKIPSGAARTAFYGLKKFTFNNMVQDPSKTHEAMTYRLFRAMGIAAPRTGYARITVNGDLYGLYLNLETPDSVMLPHWFPSTQHLLEGSYWTDVVPGNEGAFEVDEGSESDFTDLTPFLDNQSEALTNSQWWTGFQAMADEEQMTTMWAVEMFVGHWDGYAHTIWNNYYIHSDASDQWSMLPWGTDQTWSDRLSFFATSGRASLFRRCMAVADCKAMYTRNLQEVSETFATLDLSDMADDIGEVIDDALVEDPRKEHDYGYALAVRDSDEDFMEVRADDVEGALRRLVPSQPAVALSQSASRAVFTPRSGGGGAATRLRYEFISRVGDGEYSEPSVMSGSAIRITMNAGETRRVKVREVNKFGYGPWSTEVIARYRVLPTNPTLEFERSSPSKVQVSWTAVDPVGTRVNRYEVGVSVNGRSWTTARSTSTSLLLNHTADQSRYYRVRVSTNRGYTDWTIIGPIEV